MNQSEKLFTILKEIYGDTVFNIDNQIPELKAMGFNLETKRPDILIRGFKERDILIEIKTLTKQENDIEIEESVKSGSTTSFWVP